MYAGERYVYKFVCDPDALFQMALAENHRTALKMEATCIAAGGENAIPGEFTAPTNYEVDNNRGRHQYSDMLNQVYTSHLHAQLQQQQQHQHQHSIHQQPHHHHHQRFRHHGQSSHQLGSPGSLQEPYATANPLEEYNHLQQLEQYAANVHNVAKTVLAEDPEDTASAKNNNNNNNVEAEAADNKKGEVGKKEQPKSTGEFDGKEQEQRQEGNAIPTQKKPDSDHPHINVARNELLKKLRTSAAAASSTASGDTTESKKLPGMNESSPTASVTDTQNYFTHNRLFAYNSRS